MNAIEVDALLAEVFASVFARPVVITDDLSRDTWPDWDSLKHLELILSIEAALQVRLSVAQISELNSVPALRALVRSAHAA